MPLAVMPDGFNVTHRREITSLAARYRLPTIYPWRFYTKTRRPDVLRN
jgi:hypothetical protein